MNRLGNGDLSADHGGSLSVIFQLPLLDLFLRRQEHYFIHIYLFKKEFVLNLCI